ncbi:U2 snRNP-associated SURP domain-containing protein [Perkinsus olseni]|uniref:U2 snRNP-associated SURP domain-containing protein n=1 Tax=Perkinsus olseni TaxID=32597 RepID=A0A7J6SHK0_PEROL|nr:U2 snRNP-associated SURP domain-containing protein [Perkinsus olseni]
MAVGLIAAAYWAITAVVDTPEDDGDAAAALLSPALNAANWGTYGPGIYLAIWYPLFLGIASLSFEGVAAMALPIENSMANPAKFPNVLGYAVVLILILNLLFSCVMVVAVSGISDDVPGVITRAMPEGSTISQLVSACLSLELLCTYPGNAIPLFKLLERSTAAGRVFGGMRRLARVTYFSIIRIVVVAFTGVTAFVLADAFDIFLSLVGSVANASVLFVFPGICFIASSTHEDDKRRYRWAAGLVVAFGLTAAVIGTAIGARTALKGILPASH